jgi:predicted transcriptional regulator
MERFKQDGNDCFPIFGKALTRILKKKNIRVDEFRNQCGIKSNYLSDIRKGVREMKMGELRRILRAFSLLLPDTEDVIYVDTFLISALLADIIGIRFTL